MHLPTLCFKPWRPRFDSNAAVLVCKSLMAFSNHIHVQAASVVWTLYALLGKSRRVWQNPLMHTSLIGPSMERAHMSSTHSIGSKESGKAMRGALHSGLLHTRVLGRPRSREWMIGGGSDYSSSSSSMAVELDAFCKMPPN